MTMAQLEAILDPQHSGVFQGRRGASAANAVMRQHAQGTVPKVDRDRRLVEALRRGDPNAADHLITTYGDRAYRLAIRITGNRQDAEEVVQDAFWTVVRKIETFRGEAAFGSWLYRIVANAAYQKIRSRRSRASDLSLDDVLPFFDEEGRHVAPGADWSMRVDGESLPPDLRIALTSALDELPTDYRTVVVLRDIEGLSHLEIAEALGLSVPNVKTRVHRGRLFLRKRLTDTMTK